MTQISKRPSSETIADVSEEEPQIPKPPDDQSAQAEQTEEETQAQDNQPPSIYDRLGGMEAIAAAVDILYDRVFADPELVSFFVNANMKTLRKRQTQFLAQVLGGPKGYKGRNMPRAHRQLAIEQKHFARFAEHLIATLESLAVPSSLIAEVLAIVASLTTEIVNTQSPSAEKTSEEDEASNVQSSIQSNPKQLSEKQLDSKRIQKEKKIMKAVPTPRNEIAQSQFSKTEIMHSALNNLQTNIFVTDSEFNIVYANEKAIETFQSIGDAVEEAFDVSVDQLVGESILNFHQDKKKISRILRRPVALPYETEFAFNGTVLNANFNSMFDADGALACFQQL